MVRFLTSIGRALLSVSLDLHATADSRVGFPSGEIGDVNESVVCGSQQVHNSKVHDLSVVGTDLRWTEIGLLLISDFGFFLGSLYSTNISKLSVLYILEC